MEILVNDRPAGPLTALQWADLRRLRIDGPVEGRVLTRQAARDAQMRFALKLAGVLGALCWIAALALGVAGMADGMIVGGLAGGLGGAAIVAGFWVWLKLATASFDARAQGLPAAGAALRADDNGLFIGERAAPWTDLAVARAWMKTDADGDYMLQRLRLDGAFEGVDLDALMIENGLSLVSNVFLRLRAAPAA